jgi:hypothetical protein
LGGYGGEPAGHGAGDLCYWGGAYCAGAGVCFFLILCCLWMVDLMLMRLNSTQDMKWFGLA